MPPAPDVMGDLLLARRLHHQANRLWAGGDHEQARIREDQAISRLARHRWARSDRVLEHAAMLSTRARFATESADHQLAAQLTEEVITRLTPLHPDPSRDQRLTTALIELGNSYRLLANYEEARRSLTAAQHHVTTGSTNLQAATENALGILAKDTGDYEQAAAHYSRAVRLLENVPNSPLRLQAELQHNLAGLAHIQGKYSEGEAPARRAIRLRTAAGASPDRARR